MLAALVVPRLGTDRSANLASLLECSGAAADAGAGLVVLPEAALTGIGTGIEAALDLPLGEAVPGPATRAVGRIARDREIWVAFGLLEREEDHLFDTGVLISPAGELALHYRRVSTGWRYPKADPVVYREGEEVGTAATPFGTVAILLCGDLFDDRVSAMTRAAEPDLVLIPFARCFENCMKDLRRWEKNEVSQYAKRVAGIGIRSLLANSLGVDETSGSAYAVDAGGRVTHLRPPGEEGMLLVPLE